MVDDLGDDVVEDGGNVPLACLRDWCDCLLVVFGILGVDVYGVDVCDRCALKNLAIYGVDFCCFQDYHDEADVVLIVARRDVYFCVA